MKDISKWTVLPVLPVLAIAAIIFYSIGNTSTLLVFLTTGFIAELKFCLKAFPRNNKRLKFNKVNPLNISSLKHQTTS
jgi:hypothetical protein